MVDYARFWIYGDGLRVSWNATARNKSVTTEIYYSEVHPVITGCIIMFKFPADFSVNVPRPTSFKPDRSRTSLIISQRTDIWTRVFIICLGKGTTSDDCGTFRSLDRRTPYPVRRFRRVDWIASTVISSGCTIGCSYFPQSPGQTNMYLEGYPKGMAGLPKHWNRCTSCSVVSIPAQGNTKT